MTGRGFAQSLADLRPGDIGLTTMAGIVPGLFPVRLGEMLCKESFQVGTMSADHALICVEASYGYDHPGDHGVAPARAVQAMPHGAEEIALTPAKHWNTGVVWFRMQEDYPWQAEDAAAIARLFAVEQVPYSFLSYLALAAWSRGLKAERLERWIGRRRPAPCLPIGSEPGQARTMFSLPREAICSVLVDQAWSLAGKRVMVGAAHQAVTPGALAIRLMAMDGTVSAWPLDCA